MKDPKKRTAHEVIHGDEKDKCKRSQVERRVKYPCQQLRDNGNACRSGKKAKMYKVFGDAEM